MASAPPRTYSTVAREAVARRKQDGQQCLQQVWLWMASWPRLSSSATRCEWRQRWRDWCPMCMGKSSQLQRACEAPE
eukprot:5064370-Pyramimonas_sp.AAC.1